MLESALAALNSGAIQVLIHLGDIKTIRLE